MFLSYINYVLETNLLSLVFLFWLLPVLSVPPFPRSLRSFRSPVPLPFPPVPLRSSPVLSFPSCSPVPLRSLAFPRSPRSLIPPFPSFPRSPPFPPFPPAPPFPRVPSFPSLPPFPLVFRGAYPSGPSGSFPFSPLSLSLLSAPPSISTEWLRHRH